MMRQITLLILYFLIPVTCRSQTDSARVITIYNETLTGSRCYEWLEHLCKRVDSRLSGSPGAAQAVDYVDAQLKTISGIQVTKQEVMVPHWVRGKKESAFILSGKNKIAVQICALGGSVSTPQSGIKAKVLEVKNFDELNQLGTDKIKGNIVFFNYPMNPKFFNTFQAYGDAVKYRWGSASKAAKYGAIGVVVRSMTLSFDDFPHTGSMGYTDSIQQIPACAISTMGAKTLSEEIKANSSCEFTFTQSCEKLPDALSYNVIGEIKGSEFPNEVILVGGHLDAWDLGEGAHDDGAGVVQAMEMLRVFQSLNIKPKRTIRCVAFMNEENGGKGGRKYAEESKAKREIAYAAIESDGGGSTPYGFSFKGDTAQAERVMQWKKYFAGYGLHEWNMGHAGADIDHLENQKTLLIGLTPDSQRYFNYHHAASDTFDKVNKRELELGAAAMAALVYLISENGLK